MRDSKIAEIYEGTNGIQANDLVGRKVGRDSGAVAKSFVATMRTLDQDLADAGPKFAQLRSALNKGLASLEAATDWIVAHRADPHDAAAGAMPYLRLWGTVAGGWLMAKAALAAEGGLKAAEGNAEYLRAKILTAKFYGEQILPRASSLEAAATAGAATLMAMDDAAF